MYELNELSTQNLLDGWSLLYAKLAKNIMDTLGRAGEGVIREAVRRYGHDCGLQRQKLHLEYNVKTNLSNLFFFGTECNGNCNNDCNSYFHYDPRFRHQLQHLGEQAYLNDVITCPIADFWDLRGEKQLGRFFCEEFYHAMVSAYCYDISQTNISKTLTHEGDNHCRFAIYMRAANLSKNLRQQSYTQFDPGYQPPSPETLPALSVKERYKEMCLKMYYYFLETAAERFQEEGRCAVAIGLRKLAVAAADYMRLRADMTGNQPDEAYVNENFPIDFAVEQDAFWDCYNKFGAQKLFCNNFLYNYNASLGY